MKSFASLSILTSAILCLFLAPQTSPVLGEEAAPGVIYLPVIIQGIETVQLSSIIVDHTTTDVHLIPDQWLDLARNNVIHFAHTSHGSQILSGLQWLANIDPKYALTIAAYSSASSAPAS